MPGTDRSRLRRSPPLPRRGSLASHFSPSEAGPELGAHRRQHRPSHPHDSGISVSLDFRFGDKGEIVSVYTPARYRDVNGNGVPTPWEGSFRGYERMDGMMVPREGEVAWILPEGRLTYWRGRVVGMKA